MVEAFVAADSDVTLRGVPAWESALAAALLALALALGFLNVADARDAARLLVSFDIVVS